MELSKLPTCKLEVDYMLIFNKNIMANLRVVTGKASLAFWDIDGTLAPIVLMTMFQTQMVRTMV